MPHDLESVYENLTVDQVRDFIARGQEEHLTLEFKTLGVPPFQGRDDRKNLARALAGFANSAGGIVVWGVEARSTGADLPDVASGERLVEALSLALARANEFTSSGVSPVVDGVRHRALPVAPDAGFLVTLVPESSRGPHMAKAGEDRYVKRSGGSFVRMEHFEVQDMFGRRARPVLELVTEISPRGSVSSGSTKSKKGIVVLSLVNHGRGSALAPFLMLDIESRHHIATGGITGNGHEGLPRLPHAESGSHHEWGGDATRVVHPGTQLDVAGIEVAVVRANGMTQPVRDLDFVYAIAAEGNPIEHFSEHIPGQRILDELGEPNP